MISTFKSSTFPSVNVIFMKCLKYFAKKVCVSSFSVYLITFYINLKSIMSLFFKDLSTTTFIYSFVIRSALRVLAPKLIDNATNSFPTFYSGKLTINFINKSIYSVKAKVILIFSSKLRR